MGVNVSGHPGSPIEPKPAADTIFLSAALARVDIELENGPIIPRGTVVVTISEIDAHGPCFSPDPPDEFDS